MAAKVQAGDGEAVLLRGGVGIVGLSKKHQEFINNLFLHKMNGTDAYQATYPKASRESARREASRLLTNVDVKAEIQARLDEQKMSADEALAELASIARTDMADYIKFYEGVSGFYLDLAGANNKGLLKNVKKLKYNAAGLPEIELHDKLNALEKIGRYHGLFKDSIEHTGPGGGPIAFKEIIVEMPTDESMAG